MELNKDFETQRVKLQNLLNAAGGIPQKNWQMRKCCPAEKYLCLV